MTNWPMVAMIGAVLFLSSCGREKTKETMVAYVPQFEALKPIRNAPASIANAGNAVVLIQGMGTGFFISDSGLLMTNEHVVGSGNCPRQGCYLNVRFDFAQGKPNTGSTELFFTPLLIDAVNDFAVYQTQTVNEQGELTGNLATPNFLTLGEAPKLDDRVFLVGHPHAGLQKFSTGQVRKITGQWFVYDGFSLGGNSGSPIVNSQGEVVGIHHRSYEGKILITREGLSSDAIGTTSTAISAALNAAGFSLQGAAPLSEASLNLNLISIDSINSDNFADYINHNYYQRTFPNLSAPQAESSALPELTTAYVNYYTGKCQEALQQDSNEAAPDLARTLKSNCLRSYQYLHCVSDSKWRRPFQQCPSPDERASLRALADQAADQIWNLSQGGYLGSVVEMAYRFSDTIDTGLENAYNAVHALKTRHQIQMNLELAFLYLNNARREDQLTVDGVDLVAMVKNYRQYMQTDRDVLPGLDAARVLYGFGEQFLTRDELVDLFSGALNEKTTPLGAWLELESVAYDLNILP